MIDFKPSIARPDLLRRAVKIALKNKDPIPSLSDLAPRQSVEQLTALAKSWQKAGLGGVIESSENGERSVFFSLDDSALAAVEAMNRGSIRGRLRAIPRSDWIATGALIVSILSAIASGYSAYFAYLSIRSH